MPDGAAKGKEGPTRKKNQRRKISNKPNTGGERSRAQELVRPKYWGFRVGYAKHVQRGISSVPVKGQKVSKNRGEKGSLRFKSENLSRFASST